MSTTSFSGDVKDEHAGGAWAQAIALSFRFIFIVVGILGVGWLVSNCRVVRPDDRALVIRMGVVVREAGAGLLVAAPKPFETVMILPSAERQLAFEISSFRASAAQAPAAQEGPPGYQGSNETTAANQGLDPLRDLSLLVTGDMSLVYYNATLFYRITDPQAYVLAGAHLPPALERIFQASAVEVTGGRDIDTILVARPELEGSNTDNRASRETLRADFVADINAHLQDLADGGAGLGIVVNRVDLVPTVPEGAKAAFNFVLTAVQQAEKSANDARTVAQNTVQQAYRTRDRLMSEAEARAGEMVNRARQQTAPVTALTTGAQGAGDVESHLFRDRIGQILNSAGKLYTTDENGTSLIVPGIPAR